MQSWDETQDSLHSWQDIYQLSCSPIPPAIFVLKQVFMKPQLPLNSLPDRGWPLLPEDHGYRHAPDITSGNPFFFPSGFPRDLLLGVLNSFIGWQVLRTLWRHGERGRFPQGSYHTVHRASQRIRKALSPPPGAFHHIEPEAQSSCRAGQRCRSI